MADQERKSDLHDLKIALQVMTHDGLKFMIPAFATLVGVATCAGLFVWSVGELQKFSPDQIAMHRVELPAQVPTETAAPVAIAQKPPAPVVRKAKQKVVKKAVASARAPRRTVNRAYDVWDVDHPTGGRVTRSDGFLTEYSWD